MSFTDCFLFSVSVVPVSCLFFLTRPSSSSWMMKTRNLCPSSCHAQTLNTGPAYGSHSQTVSDHIMPPPANVHLLILLHTPPCTHRTKPFHPSSLPREERTVFLSFLYPIEQNTRASCLIPSKKHSVAPNKNSFHLMAFFSLSCHPYQREIEDVNNSIQFFRPEFASQTAF